MGERRGRPRGEGGDAGSSPDAAEKEAPGSGEAPRKGLATRTPGGAGRSQLEQAPEWYRDGLRFECTLCGNCCTGPEGVVWFTPEEGRAMAAALDLDEATFYRRHARRVDGRWSLREAVLEDGRHDCVFLDRGTIPGKALCRVYSARPTQCRTWPFWPENLTSRRAWTNAKARPPCPGIDSGPLIPVEAIRILRDATVEG
ncbi:MAG TPA: YkgJ family cysteine cluster protein [Phycisphaerales bacterium]|nr:YkgJ family cysteine cluster protein [Phycisphaerales bacterium]HMP36710.1 YkgJ family cysteine cluster protein [Phycisphaerales bacterium]